MSGVLWITRKYTFEELLEHPPFQLLLACIDAPGLDGQLDRIRALSADCEDCWDGFIELAQWHGVSALVAASLQSAGVAVPEQLARTAHSEQLKTMQGLQESKRLLELLSAHSVPAAVLKGPILGAALRGNPLTRSAKDIDILVDWDKFEDAIGLIEAEGYVLLKARPPFGASRLAVWRRRQKDVNLYHHGLGILVELHHRPFAAEWLMPKLCAMDASDEVAIAGANYTIFSQPELFAYLAVHGTTSFWHRLKWLADIRTLLAGSSDEQLSSLLDHCRSHGVERCGALAIILCQRHWGSPKSSQAEELLNSDRSLQALEEQSLRTLVAGPDGAESDRDLRRIFATFRLRSDWKYRRSVLRVLAYDEDLIARVPLPAGLAFLYVPLRFLKFLDNLKRRTFAKKPTAVSGEHRGSSGDERFHRNSR